MDKSDIISVATDFVPTQDESNSINHFKILIQTYKLMSFTMYQRANPSVDIYL